ncbi:hypothetical protein [Pseudofrankia sp. DC12]|uniref:hypothetical protein n=1 Tax=Pseudofrankia sp. DC12 TaxID=683315 RepID=UPI0012F96642|nr:hypothetical protein [Pseudofrankia sp. DC12]
MFDQAWGSLKCNPKCNDRDPKHFNTYYAQRDACQNSRVKCAIGEAVAWTLIGLAAPEVDGAEAVGAIARVVAGGTKAEEAASGGGRLLWTSWQNYPKVTQEGREYAQIGDRLYTQHAVDRLQPSGLGAPAGAPGAGRSISPNFVDDVLTSTRGAPVKGPNGEARLSYKSGTVEVITENNIVITVITR